MEKRGVESVLDSSDVYILKKINPQVLLDLSYCMHAWCLMFASESWSVKNTLCFSHPLPSGLLAPLHLDHVAF